MFDHEAIAKKLEWFFENHGKTELTVVPAPYDIHTSRGGTLMFHLPVIGNYGIFENILKDAYVAVTASKHRATYTGIDRNLACVMVGLHYNLIHGGSNGNSVVSLWFDNDTEDLLEYRFEGKDVVYVSQD